MSLDQAAGVYWQERARTKASASEIERNLDLWLTILGRAKPVTEIKTADVVQALAKRDRAERIKTETPSAATINRLLETLRACLLYVQDVHEVPIKKILWRELMRRERKAPERTFSDDEMNVWGLELDPLARFFLATLLTYGPRFGELFCPPEAVDVSDPARPQLMLGRYRGRRGWKDERKDGNVHAITLSPGDAAIFAGLAQRARDAKAEIIWVEAHGTGWREVGYFTMRNRLRDAAARAGVRPGRLIHSTRHHAATTITRMTKDIVQAKRLLGHAAITTTARYAHAREDELTKALDEVSRTRPKGLLSRQGETLVAQGVEVVPPPGLEPGTKGLKDKTKTDESQGE
jgi:site-specific recombinase XerD